MKKVLVSSLGLVAFAPMLASAQNVTNINGLMDLISSIVAWGVPVLGGIAILYFIWEVIKYTISSDEEGKKAAKTNIIWAVVGIFVIFSIWGLVGILQNSFGGSNNPAGQIQLPVGLNSQFRGN